MSKDEQAAAMTPAECVALLPEIPLAADEGAADEELRRGELRHAILDIAELNHVNESRLVREVVKNALGKLPDIEE
ncbi:MAG TPA: hypothetical protein VF546_11780 [Pyrinomonadaceae bacterium]|jgi:hypothetical protein